MDFHPGQSDDTTMLHFMTDLTYERLELLPAMGKVIKETLKSCL